MSGLRSANFLPAVLLASAGAYPQVPPELRPEALEIAATPSARSVLPLAPSEPMPPGELEAFVDGTVRLAMDQAHIAGVAVAIVQDGGLVLEKGYGFASFEPVRPVDPATTLFRIGSITKTFTWIAVMKVVEAGRIDLDAPIDAYLPANLQIPDDGFERPIRMRDLMTHSPGFDDRALGVLFANDPARILPLHEFLRAYRPRRVREPGILSSYSNYGTALAGAAVAEVERTVWQELIEREILEPLGLEHVSVREPYPARDGLPEPMSETLARDLSNGFRWNGMSHTARSFEYITQTGPAGAMSASARDMARYMLMLLGDGTLDGVRIFGPVAARAFRTPMTSLPPEVGALDAGFFESRLPGGFRGYGHNGGTLSFFTNMTVVPELRLGVFVATNTEGGAQLSDPLPSRIVERFYGPPRRAPDPGTLDVLEAARAYAGEYLATRRRYEGLEGFVMRLRGGLPVAVAPGGYLLVRFGPELQRFVPTATRDVFRPADGTDTGPGLIRFERDGERAARITLPSVAFERVEPLYRRSTLLLATVLALFTAAAIVVGACLRIGRKLPASSAQRLAGRVQLAAALAWWIAAGSFLAWAVSAADVVNIFYSWPGPLVIGASTAALAAAVMTFVSLLFLPAVWRGSLDGGSWPVWRKVRFTVALAAFGGFAVVLGAWGALQPWAP